MHTRLAMLITAALGMAVGLTACDAFAEYTVINDTNEELLTWPLLDDCTVVIGKNGEYLHTERIEPRERHVYFDAYSPSLPNPGCVQVSTSARRLVLSEPYRDGAVYTVREPLKPGVFVPPESDLPDESLREQISETPPGQLLFLGVSLVFGLGVIAGLLFAVFLVARFFWRFYVTKT